ncbi:hypothetical protein GCM10009847_06400 [Leucobacter tardus]|uniref:Heavy-metal-associated domain-containing protein n=1 Tax=Leucobacter tardus TaxID=501483 RepID=A0A939TLW6_9MICO|nr:heavy-metal-associated domain-containing protein [Leucobacter tardus]MBO2988843.1 heavy-metal-associated domain-containing protein [Leucobacter tardus]
MNTPVRLSLYGLGLVVAFVAAFFIANAVVPPTAVEARMQAAENGSHAGHGADAESAGATEAPRGVTLESDGFILGPVAAPHNTGEAGELSFTILDADGAPLTEYTESHEKDLHLIVVRTDGEQFRHVHPEIDEAGVWSVPWEWDEAGSYRVFADFQPGDAEEALTLTRTLNVNGDFAPADVHDTRLESSVDGYDVALEGDLYAGASSTLTLTVTRDGEPVTAMEPYLGAFGHLVALRDGDLEYLHVHPEGDEPEAGDRSGPDVEFATEAPTPGRYLLYFDFQVEGEVRTASFVVDTATGDAPTAEDHGDVESGEEGAEDHGDDH